MGLYAPVTRYNILKTRHRVLMSAMTRRVDGARPPLKEKLNLGYKNQQGISRTVYNFFVFWHTVIQIFSAMISGIHECIGISFHQSIASVQEDKNKNPILPYLSATLCKKVASTSKLVVQVFTSASKTSQIHYVLTNLIDHTTIP